MKIKRELLHRFIAGVASEQETRQLVTWFEQSGSKDEFFVLFDQSWNESSDTLSEETKERLLTRLQQAIVEKEPAPLNTISRRPLWRSWQGAVAVAAIALLVISNYVTLEYTLDKQKQLSVQQFTVSAGKGQRAFVTLPDSSQVWLNSDSRISYPADYGIKERNIELEGEAYFEVAKDHRKRFVVKANRLEVEALGTAFNINAYREENSIVASLFSGSIRVIYDHYNTILKPNESIEVDLLTKRIYRNSGSRVTDAALWRNNELVFKGESLEEIARIMNRQYNVTVQIRDQSIRNETYAGTVHNNNLQNLLDIISLTTPIRYHYSGDTIYIERR